MLQKLLDKQKKLDELILLNKNKRDNCIYPPKQFLTEKIAALSVEVAEFANEVESFKYWKENKKNNREKQIGEYVDILFFWLSIGNDMEFTEQEVIEAYNKKYKENIERQDKGY